MKQTTLMALLAGIVVGGLIAVFVVKKMNTPAARMRQPQQPMPAGSYNNDETWDITWTKDGLPAQVKISRKALRA